VCAVFLSGLTSSHSAEPLPECQEIIGRVVSIQGRVEVRRGTAWRAVASLDTPLCGDDVVRTAKRSRASVVLKPQTVIRIDQGSLLRLRSGRESIEVEMFKDDEAVRDYLDQGCGAGYFITRFPRKFKVYTPYLNAAVEGTEFQVALACDRATLSVLEGRVSATSPLLANASVTLASGEVTSAGSGQAPSPIVALVRPEDAVQWALFYPPTMLQDDASVASGCEPGQIGSARCLAVRAESALRAGRVEDAKVAIDALRNLQPDSPEALALSAVIAVVKNDKQEGLRLARAAVKASSSSSAALLALSYAEQAHFNLGAALAAARAAAALEPGNSVTLARQAELLLATGDTREARRVAASAASANPASSRAHMVLGYAALAQLNVAEARAAFGRAIELDSTDPLPRLGLGLAVIRGGKVEEGRSHIEIAVALDPANALLRSYLGKAYQEENTPANDTLAEGQYALAKQLDPKDPTPFAYSGALRQTQNRLVEALHELQSAQERNDNRAVYRSQFLLDSDRAARADATAGIYTELGFDRLALTQAVQSAALDPAGAFSHRFLADAFEQEGRQEIARTSELLQAQLAQPLNAKPVRPQTLFRDIAQLGGQGPSRIGLNEYSSLFERDGFNARIAGLKGSLGTWGDEVLISAMSGRIAFSAGQFHYESEGFRANNDVTHDIYSAFAQVALTSWLHMQAELRQRDTETGDLSWNGDPDLSDKGFRHRFDHDISRIGLRFTPTQRVEVLVSYVHAKLRDQLSYADFFGFGSLETVGVDRANQAEIQGSLRTPGGVAVLGIGGYNYSQDSRDDFAIGFCLFPTCEASQRGQGRDAYAFWHWMPLPAATVTLGGVYKDIHDGVIDYSRWSPQLALVYSGLWWLSVRAAAFESVKQALVADQTLEPAQLAGFGRFHDDTNATVSRGLGLAVETKLDATRVAGIEFSARKADFAMNHRSDPFFIDLREHRMTPYLYAAITPSLVVSAKHVREVTKLPVADALNGGIPSEIRTRRSPVALNLRWRETWARVTYTHTAQTSNQTFPAVGDITRSAFTTWDVAMGYQLPRRKGVIAVEIKNLTDRRFDYQDTGYLSSQPVNQALVPQRTVQLRLSVQF